MAMTNQTLPMPDANATNHVNKRLELIRRFTQAGFADTSLFTGIPHDVLLFLLPGDDPAFVVREITAGAESAQQGDDVFFRHVRVADLPT
jgi:hypothetical protein